MPEVNSAQVTAADEMLPEYRKTALLVSTYLMLIFVLRYIAVIVINLFVSAVQDTMEYQTMYIIQLSISGFFLQILPSVIGAFMFGYIGQHFVDVEGFVVYVHYSRRVDILFKCISQYFCDLIVVEFF